MKARKWVIYLASDEWGNCKMEELARQKFADDPTIDCITVYEHAGWYLGWTREMLCISTANDMARLDPRVHDWARQFTGIEVVGYERRGQCEHKYDCYWPCLAAAVA